MAIESFLPPPRRKGSQPLEIGRKGEAVGYDAVRSLRCAAWLRERSLALLEEHDGDARLAFDGLVDYFQKMLHASGCDCDQPGMRYFLADEFGRCNVFPNPE